MDIYLLTIFILSLYSYIPCRCPCLCHIIVYFYYFWIKIEVLLCAYIGKVNGSALLLCSRPSFQHMRRWNYKLVYWVCTSIRNKPLVAQTAKCTTTLVLFTWCQMQTNMSLTGPTSSAPLILETSSNWTTWSRTFDVYDVALYIGSKSSQGKYNRCIQEYYWSPMTGMSQQLCSTFE